MCLTRSNTKIGPKYATQDIVCYKVLYKIDKEDDVYYSPFVNFMYKLNKRVSSNFGFRCCTLPPSPQEEYIFLKKIRNFEFIHQGLHSFKYLIDAYKLNNPTLGDVVMKCIIPKGSWYYDGVDNTLVSDNIIIIEEVRTFDESFYHSRIK